MKDFKMKFLAAAIVAVCLCSVFTSCSDDDDNIPADFTGSWQSVSRVFWSKQPNGVIGSMDEVPNTKYSLTFNEDGTVNYYSSGSIIEYHSYAYADGKLKFYYDYGNGPELDKTYKVLLFTNELLVLEKGSADAYANDRYGEYEKITYQKITINE